MEINKDEIRFLYFALEVVRGTMDISDDDKKMLVDLQKRFNKILRG